MAGRCGVGIERRRQFLPRRGSGGQTVEPNLAGFEFLGDRFAVVDCPGSSEFGGSEDLVLPAVDQAIVVVDPQPDKAMLAQPILRALERMGLPHALFVNKIDQARGGLDLLVKALEAVAATPLVMRQLPTFEGEKATGFIDLALERAFVYRPGQASARIDMPSEIVPAEADARFHMLEQLAEYDDVLLEQLCSDVTPSQDQVFADLVTEMREGKITPVFFGSAQSGFGIRRLLKALRHETPPLRSRRRAARAGRAVRLCLQALARRPDGKGRLCQGAGRGAAGRGRPFTLPGRRRTAARAGCWR